MFLGDLETAIRASGNSKIVLAGDLNALYVEWGSRIINPRGGFLSDLSASLVLTLANIELVPNFVRGIATSIIDVTFLKKVELRGWQVLETESLSDHCYVVFSTQQAPALVQSPATTYRGWSVRGRDDEVLTEYLNSNHVELIVGPASVDKASTSA